MCESASGGAFIYADEEAHEIPPKELKLNSLVPVRKEPFLSAVYCWVKLRDRLNAFVYVSLRLFMLFFPLLGTRETSTAALRESDMTK